MIDLNASPGPKSALAQARRLTTADLTDHVETIARHCLGAPNQQLSTREQWRYGTNGSLAIEISGEKKGAWFDHEGQHGGADPWSLMTEHCGNTPESARDALTTLGIRDAKQKARIVATYDYHDPQGRVAYQVVRFVPKTFRQRRPDAAEPTGWTWKVKGLVLYPYHLSEILAAAPDAFIFIGEGEKDCDNLARLGAVATTNPGGAGKWSTSFAQWLAGRFVVILPDNDSAGAAHAQHIAGALEPICPAVRVLELPGLPPKGDVSSWLEAGGTLEQLQDLARACPVWKPLNGHATPAATPPDGVEPIRAVSGGEILPPAPGASQAVAPKGRPPDWTAALALFTTGEPKPTLDNAAIAFERDPAWRDVIWYDEFSDRIMARRPPPWVKANGHWESAAWSDSDALEATRWLQAQGVQCIPPTVRDAIRLVATRNRYHPVRDYLDGLVWDRTPRLDTWLSYFLGADDDLYTRAIGARWMISACARIFNPGVKADHVVVLVGDQGVKKSMAARLLCKDDRWFTDSLDEMGSKDSAMQVAGVWLIELSELDSMTKGEQRRVKAFVSRTTERFRPPYGHYLIERPRQCVFIGTTNEDDFLRDPTGARRFWPVRCPTVDENALWAARDQLWAEAVARYRAGEAWYLHEEELVGEAREHQREFQEEDPWTRAVMDYVYGSASLSDLTMAKILGEGLGLKRTEWTRAEQMRVAGILKQHQYKRERRFASGIAYYVYTATVAPEFVEAPRDLLSED